MTERPTPGTITIKTMVEPTEWSEQYLQGMLNRIAVSRHKYGLCATNFPDRVNALLCAEQRVAEYIKTGNTEFLIDAGNFLMFEFMFPRVPDAHYRATDSRESPGIVMGDGTIEHTGSAHG